MANKRIDQLPVASNIEVQMATKIPVDVAGNMKAATLLQVKDKFIPELKTINGQSLAGPGNIVISGSSMTAAGEVTEVYFQSNKYYGTASNPVAGNITYNFTGAQAGVKAIIFHQDSVLPTTPAGTVALGNVQYVTNTLNIITLTFISTDTILMEVHRTTSVGLYTEVQAWLDKGGVATGFLLTALNQFMIDIASVRTKIFRFNPLYGETFQSCFVPLIVNDNSSGTPLGSALDTNYGILSSQWKNIGIDGAIKLPSGGPFYIDTGFIPNEQALYGLNDCSFGILSNVAGDANTRSDFGTISIGGTQESYITHGNAQAALNGTNITHGGYNSNSVSIVSRISNSEFCVYKNGVKQQFTNSSVGKSINSFKLGHSVSSNVIKTFTGGYFIGKGLTDAEELTIRSAWVSLIQKTGRI